MKENARYLVGIDLGTTNSAMAVAPLYDAEDPPGQIEILPVPQLGSPGEVIRQNLLPSSLYLLEGPELPRGSTRLPWTEDDLPFIVGELARKQGALVPGRLIQSAKSWLSHSGVDRSAPILPWGVQDDWIQKLSPVEVQARYLEHLKAAFDAQHPDAPLSSQEIVITIPASFDDVARALTLEAAARAGIGEVRLLEEPQAAFYSFLLSHRENLREAIGEAQVILVVDIGGGTTDFSLIEAKKGGALPELRRIAVGDHILLGGDNMDQALARAVEARTVGAGKLDGARFWQLVQQCRLAKEDLLSPEGPESVAIKVLARGSKLFGKTLSTELSRAEVEEIVLEGFFPRVDFSARPERTARGGLKEWGLPYAKDPGIPRHLAEFLAENAAHPPDAILFHGGVLKPRAVSGRLLEIVQSWYEGRELRLLESFSLDLAVARGAAAFGLSRRGMGLSIGGGTPRGYYVGIEVAQERMGLCVVPKGSAEGTEIEIDRDFVLRLGRPVRFPLFTSRMPRKDAPGALVSLDESFRPLPPIQTVLQAEEGREEAAVRMVASVTEISTLALSLAARDTEARWRLEFALRESSYLNENASSSRGAFRFKEAKALIEAAFREKATPREAKSLGRSLEKTLGRPRNEWPTGLCRDLYDILQERAAFRQTSLEAEAAWLNLSGFLLRPGFGSSLDDWRVKELWNFYPKGIAHREEKRVRLEWWILWRRVAGGLLGEQQERVFKAFDARLRAFAHEEPPSDLKQREARDQELEEVIRLAASLERLPEATRAELGGLFLRRAETFGPKGPLLWGVGRLGARVLFYGSGHEVVRRSIVERWLTRLLAFDWKTAEGAAFAAAQIARRTGDRDTDLDEELREETALRLVEVGAPENWVRMVRESIPLEGKEQQQVFGESLPSGLRLAE